MCVVASVLISTGRHLDSEDHTLIYFVGINKILHVVDIKIIKACDYIMDIPLLLQLRY
jgi:hypothetical protein